MFEALSKSLDSEELSALVRIKLGVDVDEAKEGYKGRMGQGRTHKAAAAAAANAAANAVDLLGNADLASNCQSEDAVATTVTESRSVSTVHPPPAAQGAQGLRGVGTGAGRDNVRTWHSGGGYGDVSSVNRDTSSFGTRDTSSVNCEWMRSGNSKL
mmetsp:Transcript_44914/g.72122  ORF Transcript_44914/g.72122 Transcript_44914/m.72122 type:complete len:156 (+) Transcript_44914:159-626(+)